MGFDPTISNNYKLALSRLSYRVILAPTGAICIRLDLNDWEFLVLYAHNFLVGIVGLEPTRSYEHQHLKLACLPIPAYPHEVDFYLCTDGKSTKTTQRFIKLALPPTTYWV